MSDPRYDEQFRRGYDGPPINSPRETPPSAAPAPAPEPERKPDPKPKPAVRIPDPPVVSPPQEPGQAPTLTHERDPNPDPHEAADWIPPARNPYRLALLLVGIAMLLGGGLVIWFGVRSTIDQTGVFGVAQQSAITIEYLVPPALITGGLVSFIVWLVLGALAGREGRG